MALLRFEEIKWSNNAHDLHSRELVTAIQKGEGQILEINYRIIRLSEILKLELRYDY